MNMKKGHTSNGLTLLLVFGVILVCVTSVAAETYYAGDSNGNGHYQITLIINPDGSESLSYAGVVGGEITSQGDFGTGQSQGVLLNPEPQNDFYQEQDLKMDGLYRVRPSIRRGCEWQQGGGRNRLH